MAKLQNKCTAIVAVHHFGFWSSSHLVRGAEKGADLRPDYTSHRVNLTPKVLPCRQITSQLRLGPLQKRPAESGRESTKPLLKRFSRHYLKYPSHGTRLLYDLVPLSTPEGGAPAEPLARYGLSLLASGKYRQQKCAKIFLRKSRRALRRQLLPATAGSISGRRLQNRLQRLVNEKLANWR
jgi:hypothetical protein